MKMFFRNVCFLIFHTFLWVSWGPSLCLGAQEELATLADKKPYTSKNIYREFELDNGLKVLLVSNPDRSKASASMDVGVGSLAAPKEFPGLSHFLEHLLFLGTEKYPQEGEYGDFIARYQGSQNAYTSTENTNYHFNINHEGFAEALDRFAHFFIDPTFDPRFVEKERKAVHDEAAMYKNDDARRNYILQLRQLDPNHPYHNYHPGDLNTLDGITSENVRNFYETHYSAADMSLVLDSRFSLDEMEHFVRRSFSEITNRGVKKQVYPTVLFAPDQLPMMITVKSKQDKKILNLKFFSKNLENEWRSKPDQLISSLLGHEGKGSLLASLKRDGLAYELSAGFYHHSFSSLCEIKIDLSTAGLERWEEVVERFFAYVSLLKNQSVPRFYFEDLAKIAELSYLYKNYNTSNAFNQVINKAVNLRKHPALEFEQRASLFFEYDPEKIREVLEDIHPGNMMLTLSHPEVRGDLFERDFAIEYSRKAIGSATLNAWKNVTLRDDLRLPEPNRYVPREQEVELRQEAPEKLNIHPYGPFWYQADSDLLEPKAFIRILLITPRVNLSPIHRAYASLYELALAESLNEWQYELELAGLRLQVRTVQKGVEISVFGFSENILLVLSDLSTKLRDIPLTQDNFILLKENLKSKYINFYQKRPYEQIVYDLKHEFTANHIHLKSIFDPRNESGTQPLDLINLKDFHAFSAELFSKVAVEGSAYGQVDKIALQRTLRKMLAENLAAQPLAYDDHSFPKETAKKLTRTQEMISSPTAMGSHAYGELLVWGKRSPDTEARVRLGMAFLETHFFEILRTQKNLGYVVALRSYPYYDQIGLHFLVQSTDYKPSAIKAEVDEWKTAVPSVLAAITPEAFRVAKEAIIAEVSEAPRTLPERFAQLDLHAYTLRENFSYEKELCAALEALTQAELVAAFTTLLQTGVSIRAGVENGL